MLTKISKQKRNKPTLLNRLQKDIVIVAEGYVFELEKRGYIKAGPYVPEVVLDFPNAVKELHREFLRAGSDVIEALTYYANENKLADIGRAKDFEKLNRKAVQIANEVANEGSALVAGNICNTWLYDPNNKKESSKIVKKMYKEQLQWAVEEGIDFVISETNDYVGKTLIGLEVIKEFGLPAVVNFATVNKNNKTYDGYDYVEACKILEANGADVVGLNCTRGPATILPMVEKIRKNVNCYVAAIPVPYKTTRKQPTFMSIHKNGRRLKYLELDDLICNRFEIADFAKKAKEIGVNMIGVCCGANASHIRSIAEELGRTVPASKYSPAFDLHPMIGKKVSTKHKNLKSDWRD